MQLRVDLNDDQTTVLLPDDNGQLVFATHALKVPDHGVVLRVQGGQFVGFDDGDADEYVAISIPWTTEPQYLRKALQGDAIPKAQQPYVETVKQILSRFGVQLTPAKPKKRPAKATHRFTKTLADTPFMIDHDGSKATVYWRKRNEMEILPGATLSMTPHVTKDGALGIDTKFGDKLRADHQNAIAEAQTTASIVLRSVNEVGLFLYYGGTNSWLQLKDAQGKTLDEWTKVQ
ncbi:hypothetical protein [Lacticaseibacillus porcinae]|uniref:hypothetical protein n=1 Tax=Lacticaseibacillus porcinae TaxID=1123687 RepID=UPI000F77740E|nr:hypothetical protein [Lacticaseibacillus porcinae]